MRRVAAFGGADFVHELGRQDSDNQTRPVGDRIAEEGSPVGVLVGMRIEHDPGKKDQSGDDAQGMAVEEAPVLLFHGKFDENCWKRVGCAVALDCVESKSRGQRVEDDELVHIGVKYVGKSKPNPRVVLFPLQSPVIWEGTMRRVALLAAVLLAAFRYSPAQDQDFSKVQMKVTRVNGSVYMLEGAGGNIGASVGDDGIVIVDDQYAPLADKIRAALKGITNKPLRFVINTHYHADHTGGNPNFGSEGGIIISQENTRKRLSADQFNATFKMEQKAISPEGLPKITFTESITLHLNGQTVEVYHVKNAHTDGDAIIYFKEANVLHAGDVFVRYGLPFIDQSNGGSIDGMISGTDKILSTANDKTVIIPGHGELANNKDVMEYRTMLQTVRQRVADQIKNGKSLDEIIASDPTKGYKTVFEKAAFVNTIYYSLKK